MSTGHRPKDRPAAPAPSCACCRHPVPTRSGLAIERVQELPQPAEPVRIVSPQVHAFHGGVAGAYATRKNAYTGWSGGDTDTVIGFVGSAVSSVNHTSSRPGPVG